MSSVLVCFALFIWHLLWNAVLNKSQGNKLISMEQIVVSMVTGIALQIFSRWSVASVVTLVFIVSLAYYINLIHARFFGHNIPSFQIKQFLFSKETATVNGAMLFQAAGQLIKVSDLLFFTVFGVVLTTLVVDFDIYFAISPLWTWGTLNGLLVILIMLTIGQFKSIKNGTIDPHKFGMFLSYYFLWLLDRRRQLEQELMLQAFAAGQLEEKKTEEDLVKDEWFGRFKGMNVILVQLESFQQFLLHRKVEGQEITPFLNRLAREQIEFTDIFSQFAMGHTADAELAVLQSLYPMKNEIVNYKHYDKKYYGLPKILKKHGYQAMAYHGYKGDFYNRRTMMNTHGFEAFFSEEDYLYTERASYWMSDFSFFEQSVQKIRDMKQPFFSFMISLTSHFPYKLDEKYKALQLSKDVPEFLDSYYQSVNYTDRALQHFYECLEQDGLNKNTIFAFYGDHEGVSVEHLPDLYEQLGLPLSEFLNAANRLSVAKVPFIIASGDPDKKVTLTSNKTGSTMDVGQTLLHLLGLPKISYGMGDSLFTAQEDRVIPLTQYPLGSFATRDMLCYASASGDYLKSVIFDRENGKVILPISGTNKNRFDNSKQQVIKSDYVIVNDLMVNDEQINDVEAEIETVTFTPNVELILNIVNDQAVVIPISRELDESYLKGQNNDLDSMKRLEDYYRKVRKKNIRFYSTFDFDENDKPVYFEDMEYQSILNEKGYKVDFLDPVPVPIFLTNLPDHVLIVVTVKDEAANQFKPDFAKQMVEYGFHQLDHTKYRNSYINLIYKNKGFISLFEEVSELPLEKYWDSRTLIKGVALPFELQVASRGALVGNTSQIRVNRSSYSLNLRGLNIAVVDMETSKVIKVSRADTYTTTNIDNGMYVAVRDKSLQGVGV